MAPWAEICMKDNTQNTPLTPFMDSELLQHCHLNLSNEKLKATGYRLKVPMMTEGNVEEVELRAFKRFEIIFFNAFHRSFFPDRQRFRKAETSARITSVLRLIALVLALRLRALENILEQIELEDHLFAI